MRKIRFMLEYNCIPVWLYDSNGDLIGPGIPKEMEDDHEFVKLISEINGKYDSLFENNAVNFEYLGFSDEIEKQTFFLKVSKAIDMLKAKASNAYNVQVDFDWSSF